MALTKVVDALMDKRVKTGTFTRDISTASGTQAITGVGFLPKLLILRGSLYGGINQSSEIWIDGTGNKPSEEHDSNSFFDQTAGIGLIIRTSVGSATYSHAQLSSFDTDGFTLTWTKVGAASGTGTIHYIAFE